METTEFVILRDKINELIECFHDSNKRINEHIQRLANKTQSAEINDLAAALSKAQAEIQVAQKKETNPFFKSKYADFPEIIKVSRPALTKNGLAVTQQLITDEDGMTWLETRLLHISGQWMLSKVRILPPKNDIQSYASCVTYNRRYSYAALINIASEEEDDDGEAAMYDQRQVMAKGTALNTKYNPKENAAETITKEQREELEYEIADYADIAEMILDGFKIRSIADMPKAKFIAAINRVREIKQVREGK